MFLKKEKEKKKRLPRVFGHEVDDSSNFSSQYAIYIYIYILVFTIELASPWKGGQGLAAKPRGL